MARTLWQRIRIIWITTGISLTSVFVGWCLIAYAARGDARQAAVSDDAVQVVEVDGTWSFTPVRRDSTIARGLILYPGALVDPRAYAPYARAIAAASRRPGAHRNHASARCRSQFTDNSGDEGRWNPRWSGKTIDNAGESSPVAAAHALDRDRRRQSLAIWRVRISAR